MKNKVLAMMIGITAALTTNAQVNYRMQTACHPEDVKTYTTEKLRERFVMEKVLSEDAIQRIKDYAAEHNVSETEALEIAIKNLIFEARNREN